VSVSKLIKFLATWMLVIAMPIQGIAATGIMNCEQSSSHESEVYVTSHGHDMHSGHDEATGQDHMVNQLVNHAQHHSSSNKHACSQCDACNVCCASAAIVTSSFSVPSEFDIYKVNFAYSTPRFTSFVSAGLERPPRIILS
jgi:MinD superfamily P-loop ATPase